MTEILSTEQAAARLGVAPHRLRRALPAWPRRVGRARVFVPEDLAAVRALLEGRGRPPREGAAK